MHFIIKTWAASIEITGLHFETRLKWARQDQLVKPVKSGVGTKQQEQKETLYFLQVCGFMSIQGEIYVTVCSKLSTFNQNKPFPFSI